MLARIIASIVALLPLVVRPSFDECGDCRSMVVGASTFSGTSPCFDMASMSYTLKSGACNAQCQVTMICSVKWTRMWDTQCPTIAVVDVNGGTFSFPVSGSGMASGMTMMECGTADLTVKFTVGNASTQGTFRCTPCVN